MRVLWKKKICERGAIFPPALAFVKPAAQISERNRAWKYSIGDQRHHQITFYSEFPLMKCMKLPFKRRCNLCCCCPLCPHCTQLGCRLGCCVFFFTSCNGAAKPNWGTQKLSKFLTVTIIHLRAGSRERNTDAKHLFLPESTFAQGQLQRGFLLATA